MTDTARLLERLDRIGAVLRDSGHALALIGLGSVGLERDRLDAWSDLDFFVASLPLPYVDEHLSKLGKRRWVPPR